MDLNHHPSQRRYLKSRGLYVHLSQACKGETRSRVFAGPILPSQHRPWSAWSQTPFALPQWPKAWLSIDLKPSPCFVFGISPLQNSSFNSVRRNSIKNVKNSSFAKNNIQHLRAHTGQSPQFRQKLLFQVRWNWSRSLNP